MGRRDGEDQALGCRVRPGCVRARRAGQRTLVRERYLPIRSRRSQGRRGAAASGQPVRGGLVPACARRTQCCAPGRAAAAALRLWATVCPGKPLGHAAPPPRCDAARSRCALVLDQRMLAAGMHSVYFASPRVRRHAGGSCRPHARPARWLAPALMRSVRGCKERQRPRPEPVLAGPGCSWCHAGWRALPGTGTSCDSVGCSSLLLRRAAGLAGMRRHRHLQLPCSAAFACVRCCAESAPPASPRMHAHGACLPTRGMLAGQCASSPPLTSTSRATSCPTPPRYPAANRLQDGDGPAHRAHQAHHEERRGRAHDQRGGAGPLCQGVRALHPGPDATVRGCAHPAPASPRVARSGQLLLPR